MNFFTSTDQLVAAFGNIQAAGFYSLVHLGDIKVGFSVQCNYPSNIRYKPAVGQKSKTPDNIAVIWVVYTQPELANRNIEVKPERVPIRIKIAKMSKYRSRNWDYDFTDVEGDCPSKESFEASAATPQPIDLDYPDEFFFNHNTNSFIDKNGDEISGINILKKVFNGHCDTVHRLKGLTLKTKLMSKDKIHLILSLTIDGLEWILKHGFGRTIERSAADVLYGLYKPYPTESLKKLNEDSIDLLGYKASRHVIILFCAMVIMCSAYRYMNSISGGFVSYIGQRELLAVCYGIFIIWIIDDVIPWCIFWLINLMIRLKTKIIFMRVKGP